MERKLITIVAMDVVGYSRMMERDEEKTLRHLNGIRASVLEPSVACHSGRIVKTMGDGALLEFSSVVSALQCAIKIQKDLAEKNTGPGGESQLHYRIGIHLGDVIAEGVVAAVKDVGLEVPLVVRLEGTRVKEGKDILAASGLNVVAADDLDDAAKKIVAAVG